MLPRIALTHGDPAGIGPEIVARVLADPATTEKAEIHLIASLPALAAGAKAAGVPMPVDRRNLTIVSWARRDEAFEPSVVAAANGGFILDSLRAALELASDDDVDAICFAPLNKGAMRLGGMHHEDEMRWLADVLDHRGACGEFNVLGPLWTARVTSHIALKDVSSHLSREGVATAIRMLTTALKGAGVETPRIGVCGLNPHNGDNGNYGTEEGEIIEPGIALAASEGYPSHGPYPADTIFLRAKKEGIDGIVNMYHDQGQIATKLLGFDIGVTVYGGLPIPIMTPAHGTAYDIVGQGVAQSNAMVNALDLACRMGLRRRRHETSAAA